MKTMSNKRKARRMVSTDGFASKDGAVELCKLTNRLMKLYVEEEDYESAALLRDAHEEIGSVALGYTDWTDQIEDTAFSVLTASKLLLEGVKVYVYEDEDGLLASFFVGSFEYKYPVTQEEAARLED